MKELDNIFKDLGLDQLLKIANSFFYGFKMMFNIINQLIRVIVLLLSPIADVIMALLYPILLILKPIAMMVKQIMRPFMQMMMEANRSAVVKKSEGNILGMLQDISAGLNVVMVGFSMVIYSVLSKGIELFFNFLYGIISPIFAILPIGDKIMDVFNGIKGTFDDIAINGAVKVTEALTSGLKTDNLPQLVNNLKSSLEEVFKPADIIEKHLKEMHQTESLIKDTKEKLEMSSEILVNQGTNKVSTAVKFKLDSMFESAKEQIEQIKAQTAAQSKSSSFFMGG